ncbi:hypothetical protein CRYPA_229 [uncultured Candidatus Thioglobus sp.]|nr:hypothetical protein CRYPA_229 [uncultured Candidatus Thioglobus sp.]
MAAYTLPMLLNTKAFMWLSIKNRVNDFFIACIELFYAF